LWFTPHYAANGLHGSAAQVKDLQYTLLDGVASGTDLQQDVVDALQREQPAGQSFYIVILRLLVLINGGILCHDIGFQLISLWLHIKLHFVP